MIKEKSCGAVVYRYEDGVLKILIEKMKKGHYSIPKGHVEGDETEEQTALREIKEETNLDVKLNTSFRHVISYNPYPDCVKDVVFFLAEFCGGEIINQECEVSSISWETVDDALNIITHESDKDVVRAAVKAIESIG